MEQGDQRAGWLTFELPNGVQPTELVGNLSATKPTVTVGLTSGTASVPTGQVTPGEFGLATARPWANLEEMYTVTVHEVVDPAAPASQFATPEAGNRLVAVRMSVRNDNTTASKVFLAPSSLDAVTSEGFAYEETFKSTTAGEDIPFEDVAPGATTSGWVVYEIPTTQTLVKFSLREFRLTGENQISSWRAP